MVQLMNLVFIPNEMKLDGPRERAIYAKEREHYKHTIFYLPPHTCCEAVEKNKVIFR